jgi:hypothetical protein
LQIADPYCHYFTTRRDDFKLDKGVWEVPLHSNASANHVLGVASPQFELSQYIAEVQHNTHLLSEMGTILVSPQRLRPRVFSSLWISSQFASWRKMHIRISNVFVEHNLFLCPFVTTHPLWVFALLALSLFFISPLCWVLLFNEGYQGFIISNEKVVL